MALNHGCCPPACKVPVRRLTGKMQQQMIRSGPTKRLIQSQNQWLRSHPLVSREDFGVCRQYQDLAQRIQHTMPSFAIQLFSISHCVSYNQTGWASAVAVWILAVQDLARLRDKVGDVHGR